MSHSLLEWDTMGISWGYHPKDILQTVIYSSIIQFHVGLSEHGEHGMHTSQIAKKTENMTTRRVLKGCPNSGCWPLAARWKGRFRRTFRIQKKQHHISIILSQCRNSCLMDRANCNQFWLARRKHSTNVNMVGSFNPFPKNLFSLDFP